MGRTTGRDADETRRQIIEAAARLISRRGSAVPISAIADAAGVSKGGLLYHFASKDELLEAVAGRLFDSFRDAVHDAASEDPDPGRLTRAYVRVSFADVADEAAAREMIAVAAQLMHEPRIQQIAAEDGARWREDLFGDGLDPAVDGRRVRRTALGDGTHERRRRCARGSASRPRVRAGRRRII
jgi:AcrR family transcriptional regulator